VKSNQSKEQQHLAKLYDDDGGGGDVGGVNARCFICELSLADVFG